MLENIRYFYRASFRRKLLDLYQEKYKNYYKGRVVDIGGRDRGRFKKPKNSVQEWIFIDVVAEHNPDIVADVSDMNMFQNNSVDVVSALELFEHVENIEKGIQECVRILKPDGHFVVSMPFLYPVHGDPHDYQRWTYYKWQKILAENNMSVEKKEIMGRAFTVFAETVAAIISDAPVLLRKPLKFIFLPMLVCISKLDDLKIMQNSQKIKNFHGGYFIIANKNRT